ncbi:MAG: GYD domain-containing protein [Sphingobacteriales bacterium]|jgi:uncharacterized protein with GYD domain
MATYLMFGKYSAESLKGISARRSDETRALIKKNGGELKAGYAALGGVDLVLIVDLPDTPRAMATSAALAKMTGIAFTTSPAVTIEEFDKLVA